MSTNKKHWSRDRLPAEASPKFYYPEYDQAPIEYTPKAIIERQSVEGIDIYKIPPWATHIELDYDTDWDGAITVMGEFLQLAEPRVDPKYKTKLREYKKQCKLAEDQAAAVRDEWERWKAEMIEAEELATLKQLQEKYKDKL